ncbi:fibronectin type III domain-containing protein [Salinibius halmophilus]|uniref:fibronectin type III domain-containing protein n=1 Tax=Salinibius halmophilus TaxID=1853216 RepID=UPI000E66E190|nr:fibronectin type III domain-containing protein [Salinibius halmophilus]
MNFKVTRIAFLACVVLLGACSPQIETISTSAGTSAGSKTVTLSWSPPTQREDGTRLAESEIYAYELKYRRKGEAEFQPLLITAQDANTGPVTSYSLTNLPQGDYEFLLATIDRDGLRSDYVRPSN